MADIRSVGASGGSQVNPMVLVLDDAFLVYRHRRE